MGRSRLIVPITVFVVGILGSFIAPSGSETIRFHYQDHNCSLYTPIMYDVTMFAGTWNYLELYTEDSSFPPNQLFCLKLNAEVTGMDLSINMTIPKPLPIDDQPGIPPISAPSQEIMLVTNMWGWVDEQEKKPGPWDDAPEERQFETHIHRVGIDHGIEVGEPSIRRMTVGRFELHSEALASSKWILLAEWEQEHLLYVACANFPDGTCAVGEIGIISRNTYITPKIVHEFDLVLAKYGLHSAPRFHITHDRCLPVRIQV